MSDDTEEKDDGSRERKTDPPDPDREDDAQKQDEAASNTASSDETDQSGLDVVRAHWNRWYDEHKPKDSSRFDQFWQNAVREGVIPGTSREPGKVGLSAKWAAGGTSSGTGKEICFRIDPTL